MQIKERLYFSLLLVFLFIILIFTVQHFLTSQLPGANDFYSRWHGARAFLEDKRNPYGLDVTEEIQAIIDIDPEQIGRGGFNYPLHVIYFFWPLVYLPYDWAQAIWWTVVLFLAIASTSVMLQWLDTKPKPFLLLIFLLIALTFYPISRSIFLGQFTIHVLFFLSLSLLALKHHRDFWAGFILSAASIKPQMLILVASWMIICTMMQKRWRFIQGLLLGGTIFLAASLTLMPRWPLEFLEDMRRYHQFSGGFTPLKLFFDSFWPNAPDIIWQISAVLLSLVMLFFWWKNLNNASKSAFKQSLYWTIVIQTLIIFQTGTTNQVILWIPILGWLTSRPGKRWHVLISWILIALTWIFSWTIFLRSLDGNYEHTIMFLPIPLLTFLLLTTLSLSRNKSNTVVASP